MRLSFLAAQLATVSSVALASVVSSRDTVANSGYQSTCTAISKAISSKSAVFYPGSADYANDIKHWLPDSSINSTCSVEPGSVADVQAIMKILGSVTTPFAIKSGGHSFNQGFSSTVGVQIALKRLNGVTYNKASNTVTLGLGGIWTDVYTILEAQGLTVSGGRIAGVGVGGYLLGGGYSYLTSESGLSMDNVISYEVVLPNATLTTASATKNADLFWGLKGGFNNFGIVTSAVVKAYPMGKVYGGQLIYTGDAIAQLPAALEAYAALQNSSNAVKEGGMALAYSAAPGTAPAAILQVFYHGTTPPARFLAPFSGIANTSSSLGLYSYTDFIGVVSPIFGNPDNFRADSTTVSVFDYNAKIVSAFMNITNNLATSFPHTHSASIVFEPFAPSSILRPNTDGVFPHSVYASPLNAALWWLDPADDTAGRQALDAAMDQFTAVLRADGQPVDQMMLYPNYADISHGTKQLYGSNLAQAITLRKKIDPQGVMLRTGGWKFV